MSKFGKFLFGTLSLAAVAGGLYCAYKNHVNKDADDDFDDFDDSMDEAMEEDTSAVDPDSREYVSITITTEDAAETDAQTEASSDKAESSEDVEAEAVETETAPEGESNPDAK